MFTVFLYIYIYRSENSFNLERENATEYCVFCRIRSPNAILKGLRKNRLEIGGRIRRWSVTRRSRVTHFDKCIYVYRTCAHISIESSRELHLIAPGAIECSIGNAIYVYMTPLWDSSWRLLRLDMHILIRSRFLPQTPDQYQVEYDSRRGNEYSRFHGYTYDGIWTVALAVKHVARRIRRFHHNQTISDFRYRDVLWEQLFLDALRNTSFDGVTVSWPRLVTISRPAILPSPPFIPFLSSSPPSSPFFLLCAEYEASDNAIWHKILGAKNGRCYAGCLATDKP